MATEFGESRTFVAHDGLRALVRNSPYRISFFQMVRLLERLHPERKPVGLFVAPADEVARFSTHTSLSFPASEIQSFTEESGKPNRLSVNFMGLSAVNGPLPQPYVELLLERIQKRDHAPGEFFDIFNHRIISLFYQGWKKYHFFVAYEQIGGTEDVVTNAVYHLLGLGTGGLRNRMAVPDEATVFYAGLLTPTRRSAQGLRQLLGVFFDVPVAIEQFTGTWKRLAPNDQTRLADGESETECLGRATIVGDEVWDQGGTITVRLGPMPLARYWEFLPGNAAATQLAAWLRYYAHGEFDFLIRLVLMREEVPEIKLTAQPEEMARLGFASWLKLKPFQRDPEEAMYFL